MNSQHDYLSRLDNTKVLQDSDDVLSEKEQQERKDSVFTRSKEKINTQLIDPKGPFEQYQIKNKLNEFRQFLKSNKFDINAIIQSQQVPQHLINSFNTIVGSGKNKEIALLFQTLAVFNFHGEVYFDKTGVRNGRMDVLSIIKLSKNLFWSPEKQATEAWQLANSKKIKEEENKTIPTYGQDKQHSKSRERVVQDMERLETELPKDEPAFIKNLYELWPAKCDLAIDKIFSSPEIKVGLKELEQEVVSWSRKPNIMKIQNSIERSKKFTKRYLFNAEYLKYIIWIANTYKKSFPGVSPSLLLGICHTETKFNPNVKSYAGAVGPFQFLPNTAKEVWRILKTDYTSDSYNFLDPSTREQRIRHQDTFDSVTGQLDGFHIQRSALDSSTMVLDPIQAPLISMFYLNRRWTRRGQNKDYSTSRSIYGYNPSKQYYTAVSGKISSIENTA